MHAALLLPYLALLTTSPAITQLFRLSNVFTGPSSGSSIASQPLSSAPITSNGLSALSIPPGATSDQILQLVVQQLDRQAADFGSLSATIEAERSSYVHLGKPIGGTFIAIGVLMLVIGAHLILSLGCAVWPISRTGALAAARSPATNA